MKTIMAVNDKMKDEKMEYDIEKKMHKYMQYHQVKLINVNLLLVNKYYLLIKEEYKKNLILSILFQEKL